MNSLYNETKEILNEYNIKANKNLGQNFLVDENAINKIINSSEITKNDLIIEIGPGLGTLTKRLVNVAGKVICIELDKRMTNILQSRFNSCQNLEIIQEDVLKVDLNKVIEGKKGNLLNVKIVANLPYYITTPIIMKLLEEKLKINSITIMIQKEVAERICEIPGGKNSGAITYTIYYYSIPKKIVTVPHTSFIPIPTVDSEVIKLTLREKTKVIVKDEKLLFKIIKVSFMQRRKTLVNGLLNSGLYKNREQILQILKELQIDEKVRGEKLSLEQFASISEKTGEI